MFNEWIDCKKMTLCVHFSWRGTKSASWFKSVSVQKGKLWKRQVISNWRIWSHLVLWQHSYTMIKVAPVMRESKGKAHNWRTVINKTVLNKAVNKFYKKCVEMFWKDILKFYLKIYEQKECAKKWEKAMSGYFVPWVKLLCNRRHLICARNPRV